MHFNYQHSEINVEKSYNLQKHVDVTKRFSWYQYRSFCFRTLWKSPYRMQMQISSHCKYIWGCAIDVLVSILQVMHKVPNDKQEILIVIIDHQTTILIQYKASMNQSVGQSFNQSINPSINFLFAGCDSLNSTKRWKRQKVAMEVKVSERSRTWY